MLRAIVLLATLLYGGIATATPTKVGRVTTAIRPAGDRSPAKVLGTASGGGTAITIPIAVGADTNCPTTAPTIGANNGSGWTGYALFPPTCLTGANAHGYDVTTIAVAIASATPPAHVKCSVYDNAGANHQAGCDTVEATLATNPNAYVSMATTGACHLAAGTRYRPACATDAGGLTWGTNATGQSSYASGLAYATLWPASLSQSATNGGTVGMVLTATPTP